jgi:hypothetical protein
MRIMVFLHGTLITHKNSAGKTRQEIIKQVIEQEESVRDFENYIPVGNAPKKLQTWVSQGAEICYLSALTENKKARGDETVGKEGLKADGIVLDGYDFPKGEIYHRDSGEKYKDVIARVFPPPDILIEDDCESIGGEPEMTYPSLSPELKTKIKSIVIKEFEGIDNLPDNLEMLRDYS